MPALVKTLVCDAEKKKKVLLWTGCLVLSAANLLPNLICCLVRSEAERGRSAFGLSGSSSLLVFKRRDHNLCLHREELLSNSISSGSASCSLHTPCRSSRVTERWRNHRDQSSAQAVAVLCDEVQDFVSCYGPLKKIWAGRSTVMLAPRRRALAGSHSIRYFLLQGLADQKLPAQLGKEVCEELQALCVLHN